MMNSKSVGADMVYAWPTAEIGMMEADLAAKIMYAGADADTLREKLPSTDNCSQARYLLQEEAMWIPSLSRIRRENM